MTPTPLQPYLSVILPVVTVVVGICVPVITVKVTQWLGVSIDAQHRSALDAAIETAIGKLIALGTGTVSAARGSAASVIMPVNVQPGVDYVRKEAPKSVARFKLSDDTIAEKIEARLAVLRMQKGLV